MADRGKEPEDKPAENIFRIMDEIVYQLDMTKRLFVIMIVAIVVAIPLSFHITFLLLESPSRFGIARIIPVVLVVAIIVVGLRQWFVLSKWTKRYKHYKELQKKVDEKLLLDYGNDDKNNTNNSSRGGGGDEEVKKEEK